MSTNMSTKMLTVMGSMGWIPSDGQHTCCYCYECEGVLVVFDVGTGAANFGTEWGQEVLERNQTVLVLLSHYHLDHVSGLIYLPQFLGGKDVHIAGPGKAVYGRSAEDILSRLVGPPYFGKRIGDFRFKPKFYDLEPSAGGQLIAGINVETQLQDHSDPSLGIKVGGEVSYITDTAVMTRTVDFVRGCKILLHESWLDRQHEAECLEEGNTEGQRLLEVHSSVDRVARLAADAEVEMLQLIHLNPSYSIQRLIQMVRHAEETFPGTKPARDGETY